MDQFDIISFDLLCNCNSIEISKNVVDNFILKNHHVKTDNVFLRTHIILLYGLMDEKYTNMFQQTNFEGFNEMMGIFMNLCKVFSYLKKKKFEDVRMYATIILLGLDIDGLFKCFPTSEIISSKKRNVILNCLKVLSCFVAKYIYSETERINTIMKEIKNKEFYDAVATYMIIDLKLENINSAKQRNLIISSQKQNETQELYTISSFNTNSQNELVLKSDDENIDSCLLKKRKNEDK